MDSSFESGAIYPAMSTLSTCYMGRMFRRLAALALVCACCSKSDVHRPAGDDPAPTKPTFSLIALAEVRGQIGPCGCTSDPLGDISRTAQLIADARAKGPVLFVDAGSLLYSQNPIPAHLVTEENLKADLLAGIYQNELKVGAIGLGPADIAEGPQKLRLPRTVSDATGVWAGLQGEIHDVGGAKVGVFGVIAKDAFAVDVSDPVAAGKQQVADLKQRGAQVIVALVQASSKRDAVALIHDIGGIDFSIAGLGLAAPEPDEVEIEPTKIDTGWLVIPGNRGQVVSKLDVTLRGAGPLADAVGSAAAAAKIVRDDKELASLDADLAKFKADPSADPAFIATKQRERAQLAAQRDGLKTHPLAVPAHGSFFTLDQVRINKTLACSVPAQSEVTKFYAAAGDANVKAAAQQPAIPVAKGQATYVGQDACTDCHSDEATFWKKTVHAQAWQTLVERGQQFDYDCIGCHVTGFDKPGGSTLAQNDKLRDVQCETCHGPGSIHVAKGGEEKPLAIIKTPADDLCATQCHTHEHSDTFQHEAYLRDITGPGHAPKFRAKLGDGPTGHDLRKAALDKAGRTLGAGCVR
jgi:hypothetical protein